jgi:hypothetical protein
MAYYIPFINSEDDRLISNEFYKDSIAYRVTMQSLEKIKWNSFPQPKLWVDTEVDALHNLPGTSSNEFNSYFSNFVDARRIVQADFLRRPDRVVVSNFVNAILDNVRQSVPGAGWLTIPQLPHLDGTEHNKVNKVLAEATYQWKSRSVFKGKLILPAIFVHQRQLNNKTDRNRKVSLVASCFEASGADGLWIVDSSLGDQDGTRSFVKRFEGIIRLHEELNQKLPARAISIAGPYWALNLVLWARGLVQFAAIGVGRGYKYYIPGSLRTRPANVRIALPPLRRQALWSSGLKTWIEDALLKIPKNDIAHDQFSDVLKHFHVLGGKRQARRQVAQFYGRWLKKFEEIPPEGRALALYQDFSSAYVLGKTLNDIPGDDVRSPSRIAEQFMMACL